MCYFKHSLVHLYDFLIKLLEAVYIIIYTINLKHSFTKKEVHNKFLHWNQDVEKNSDGIMGGGIFISGLLTLQEGAKVHNLGTLIFRDYGSKFLSFVLIPSIIRTINLE